MLLEVVKIGYLTQTYLMDKDLGDEESRAKYLWDNYKHKVPEKDDNKTSDKTSDTKKKRKGPYPMKNCYLNIPSVVSHAESHFLYPSSVYTSTPSDDVQEQEDTNVTHLMYDRLFEEEIGPPKELLYG